CGDIFPTPAIVTVAEKFTLSVLNSKPAGGVTRIPEVSAVPETLKLSDAEGVPYTVVSPANVPVALTAVVRVGFTVIVNVTGKPPQPVPLLAGVTVMVAITGFVPVLTAVKGVISPDPLAGSPIAGVSLVQVKPAAVPLKLMVVVVTPLDR